MKLQGTRIALAVILFIAAVSAHAADCNSSFLIVSEHGIQPNHPAGPIAWNGTVFAVAHDTPGVPVTVSLYDANLNLVRAETTVSSSPLGKGLKLITDGSKFAVVFFTPSGSIVFQEVSSAGFPVGAERIIGGSHGLFTESELDAAYNAASDSWNVLYSIPFNSDAGIWLTSFRANFNGPPLVNDVRLQTFVYPEAHPRIAVAANGATAIAWYRANGGVPTLYLVIYDPSIIFPINTILVSTTAKLPVLMSTGTSFALTYQAPVGGGTELRWLRVNSAGAITNADQRLLIGTGVDVLPVAVVWNPALSEWGITYIDASVGSDIHPGDYRIRRQTTSSVLISDTLFTPDNTKSIISGQYNAVWNGTAYYGTIERQFSAVEGSDSYLVKHCTLTGSIKFENLTPVPFQSFTFTANGSGGAAPYTYLWDFGDLSETRREQVIKHPYTHTGTFTVTLTVTDALGDIAVLTKSVTVVDTVRRRTAKK